MWEKLQGGKHNRNNLTAWLFWDREGPKSNLEQQSNELRCSYNCNYPNCFRRKLVSFSFGSRQRKKNAVEKTWAGEQLGKESSKKVQIFSSCFCLWGIVFIFIMLDKLLCVLYYIYWTGTGYVYVFNTHKHAHHTCVHADSPLCPWASWLARVGFCDWPTLLCNCLWRRGQNPGSHELCIHRTGPLCGWGVS